MRAVPTLALAVIGLLSTAPAADSAPPSIVLVFADDLGVNDLHCYGRADHRTPHLDRLAEQGMRFTCAYTAQPICSPSRAAVMTGKCPARLNLTNYLPGRPDAVVGGLVSRLGRAPLSVAGGHITSCFFRDLGRAVRSRPSPRPRLVPVG